MKAKCKRTSVLLFTSSWTADGVMKKPRMTHHTICYLITRQYVQLVDCRFIWLLINLAVSVLSYDIAGIGRLSPPCVFHMYCIDVIFFWSDKTRNIKLMYEVVLYGAFALHVFSFWSMTKKRHFLYSHLIIIHLMTFLLILPPLCWILNDFHIVKYFLVKTIANEA